MMEKQRPMCRRTQFIAADCGSPGPGAMGTTTPPWTCASLARIVILATVVCLLCVCRGVASDEEPHGSAEVVNTLWDDDNPEFRDVSLDDMEEGMDMMDREARKITVAHIQGLMRKKEREALESLPVAERAKKRAELRGKRREELEARLRRRNEKPIQIVSPFFRDAAQPSTAAGDETVGSKTPGEVAAPVSVPSTSLPPETKDTSSYKPASSVEDEEHIALSPSETTIEPAISTDSASESQQVTGAPPTSTQSQELEASDVTRQVMTDLRGDTDDVTAEENTTPSALEDSITEESGAFEPKSRTTFTPDFEMGRGMDTVYSTTESTTLEPWTEPELRLWPTSPGPTTPELWIRSTNFHFRHQPTTPAPWNESIVHDWHHQPTTPKPWTKISTSGWSIPSTYAEPTTPELWAESTTPGLHYQPTTAAPTTPQPWSYISTPSVRIQSTYAETSTFEPWTESPNHDLHHQPNTGAPSTSEPWSEDTTPELRAQPTYAAPTTLELATEQPDLEVATHEVPPPDTTPAPWPKLPAPQKSDKGQVTSRQSIEDIVSRLEKLLSVTAAPSHSPINTHSPPVNSVNHDPVLGAAQPVEFALSGRKPNMSPSRLSSASLGMAVPDYADYALLSDRHRERLHPALAWQGQAAPETYPPAGPPARPWEAALPPTGFQEHLPTIHSVPGFGPQNKFVGYSNNGVPYQGDINMMMAHLPDHTRLRDPSAVYPSAQGNTQPAHGRPSQDPVLSILSDVNLPSVPNQTLFGLRDQAAKAHYPYQSTGRDAYPPRPQIFAGPYMKIAQGVSAVPQPQVSPPELPRLYSIYDNVIPETPYEKMRAKAFDEWKDALTKKKAEALRRANAAAAASTTLTRPQRSTYMYIPGTESALQEGDADSVTVPAHPTQQGLESLRTDSPYVTPGTAGVPTVAELDQALQDAEASAVQLPAVRPPRPGSVRRIQKRHTTTTVSRSRTPEERSTHVSEPAPYLKIHESRETSTPAILQSDNQGDILHSHSQVHKPLLAVLPPNSLRKSNELRASYGGEEVDARPFRNSSQDDAEIIVPVIANMGRFTAPKRFPTLTNATIMRIVFPRHKSSGFSSGGDFPDSNFSSPNKWPSTKVDGVESPMLTALLQSNFSSQAVTPPGLETNLPFATKSAPPPLSKGATRDCEDGKCKTCQSWNCVHSSKGEGEIHSRQKRSDHVFSDAIFAHQLSFFGS